MLWAQNGGRAARLQKSRAEAGVVAAPRTEAQRMAVWDDCAEKPRGQLYGTTVQDGYAGSEAQRTAVRDGCAEKPRGQLCGQRGPEAETGLLHADLL